ncbi:MULTISPECIES: Tn3 family transposase [Pseudomonadota]|uniref:Tn3 family transposase n=4 Tax=Pseudomonadota TaxID=1224 RepID=A0A7H0GIX1_9BURK|nr:MULTISPECIES: Tn3 family transposase [Comamonadaceae]AEV57025.1 IS1071 family transposase [uncultured bacterium]EKS72230.1 transposase Tn3 family protein [Burkholderia sp. SJ98]HEB4994733.1 Tn3 family transposase [Aeromonas hydrophila subsp. hydrophila]QNP48237.1 Tn3 family transposase [Diaphorobacter aerolatus]QPN31033.1 Tn3 family transposase [Diaphorobacter sp. JS3051]
MQGWHTTFLGMRGLPRDISDFEMKAFFTFDGAERDAINARRGDSHKLGLALHIGFLRMSGRLLGAFRVIPVLVRARQWLYKNKLVIVHERAIRTLIAAALAQLEVETGTAIAASVDPATLDRWRASVSELRPDGQTQQSWLWAAPAKHSTRQISEVLERIDLLYTLDVHKHLADIPDLILRRYARRLVSRPPSAGAKIKEPARTVEVACFLRYCLFTTTDQLILMVQRRIADLWRQAAADVPATVNWAAMYKTLLGELVALSAQGAVPDAELRARLEALITETQKRKPPSRASLVREGLIDGIRPVRSLLVAIAKLPWQATGEHPAIEYLAKLQALYLKGSRKLPVEVVAPSLGMIWQVSISSPDRERAFQALEVATLFALRRAVRNGSVWIEHSLSFRGRARLFFTDERWQAESKKHYARLSLPSKAATFLKPLLARVTAGVDAVAAAARSGVLRVDDELHLSPLPAEDEDPEVTKLRAALDHRIGEVQLPEVILAVDAQVRFSWIMLGREPRSTDELLMVYAGIMAHGTSLTAVECARMIPQLSATSIRQAMRWARDERRLSQACQAVLEFMQRHPIAATWGRSDLASSDMMTMETTKRVWQARLDPRRNTPSIGIYSHVKDRWGIFHAQPFVLNERQAGVAIEGVIRQEKLETSQLAVDTHGYTDFAMSHARLLGFDLCPRLKELKQRHLFVPRGTKVPAEIAAVCEANVDVALIEKHWDSLVHLAASVMSGHASAVAALARFGSAAQGDPIYEAGVQLGRLLRTAFLADYFVKDAFRNELRRVLNRGEAVNALKRAIYTGRISPAQAKRVDEMQAVADALSLMANIVMAWNTSQMQAVLDRWSNRRQVIPPELIGKIAPTRLESINLRGVFRFPVDRYADQILPSRPNASITGTNG